MTPDRPNEFARTFKVVQINAENLFIFLDEPPPENFAALSEKEWQKLSHASVANKNLTKTRWLAQTLSEIDADIVCVNEVGGLESLTNFSRYFLNDRYQAYLIEGNSDRGIDVGYLVKREFATATGLKIELRSHKQRPLNYIYPHEEQSNAYFATTAEPKVVKSHCFSRDCSELRLFSSEADRPLFVMLLVHLKSKLDPDGIDPQGTGRRTAEASLLAKIYRETRQEFDPPVPILVAGDFNGFARPPEPSIEFKEFSQTDLQSVTSLSGKSGPEAATQILFSRTQGTLSLEIDFVFVSPEFSGRLKSDASGPYRYRGDLGVILPLPKTLEQRLALPSDHYPVVAVFEKFF